MKKLIEISCLFFIVFSLNAQNVELSNRLIRQYNNAIQESLEKNASSHNHLWLTPLLLQAKIHWKDLTNVAKTTFSVYLSRPTFSGTELIFTSGNFVFHYTTNSGIANENVDATDNNSNNVPDYVEKLALKFASVYTLYHTTSGLTIPPPDGGQVSGAYYDVYISNKEAGSGVYGYVSPESRIGDNPNSASLTEIAAYTSYMVMRSNYNGFGNEDIAMSVTVAHEYMHAVQMGYSGYMDPWFMEATATWSEEYAFPHYDDNFQYLPDVFVHTDVALNLEDGEANGDFDGHWYGEWIFIKYLTEHTGNTIIKNIYQRCITSAAVYAINNELTANWGSSLRDLFIQYLIANVIMTSSSGYAPYTYNRADDYNSILVMYGGIVTEKDFEYLGTEIDFNSQVDGNGRLMRLSSDVFTLTAGHNFIITFTPSGSAADADILLLKIGTNSLSVENAVHDSSRSVIIVTDYNSEVKYVPLVYRFDITIQNSNSVNYLIQISDTIPTNIENIDSRFKIYPNPADDCLFISANIKGNFEVCLTDITGRKIFWQNVAGEGGSIDVRRVPGGIYFLQLIKDNRVLTAGKILIKH